MSGGSEDVPLDISFTAKGTASKISMNGTSNNGGMKFKGVPAGSLPDLSGSWSAQTVKGGVKFSELFELRTFFCLDDPAPDDIDDCVLTLPLPENLYGLTGNGPGYKLEGAVIISAGNRIGFVVEELRIDHDTGIPAEAGEGIVRTVTGPINLNQRKAELRGIDDDHTNVFVTMTGTLGP